MKLFSFLDETAHIPNCLLIKKKKCFYNWSTYGTEDKLPTAPMLSLPPMTLLRAWKYKENYKCRNTTQEKFLWILHTETISYTSI